MNLIEVIDGNTITLGDQKVIISKNKKDEFLKLLNS